MLTTLLNGIIVQYREKFNTFFVTFCRIFYQKMECLKHDDAKNTPNLTIIIYKNLFFPAFQNRNLKASGFMKLPNFYKLLSIFFSFCGTKVLFFVTK